MVRWGDVSQRQSCHFNVRFTKLVRPLWLVTQSHTNIPREGERERVCVSKFSFTLSCHFNVRLTKLVRPLWLVTQSHTNIPSFISPMKHQLKMLIVLKCPWKSGGSNHTALFCLADQSYSTLSTQPNSHLRKEMFHWWIHIKAQASQMTPETTENIDGGRAEE